MKTDELILAMQQMGAVSTALNTTSWIWGGLTMDICQGKILREHHDLDYLTLRLHELIEPLTLHFQNMGWHVRRLENGDLKIEKDGIKIHAGHVMTLKQEVRWTHNGDLGSLYFPVEWLSQTPKRFQDSEIHVIAPALQYVLLNHPEMLNPAWIPREKDRLAKAYFKTLLEADGVDLDRLKTQIHA